MRDKNKAIKIAHENKNCHNLNSRTFLLEKMSTNAAHTGALKN